MKPSIDSPLGMMQRDFVTFVIWHTCSFEEAVEHLDMDVCTLRDWRRHFKIATPHPDHYTGPKLSREKMYEEFWISRAPATPPALSLKEVLATLKMTVTVSGSTVVLPLSEALTALPPGSSPAPVC